MGGERLGDVFRVGLGLLEVFGHSGALLWGKYGDGGQDAAQSDGDVIDVIHETNGFSGKRHVDPLTVNELHVYCRG